jgi:hypothetical protein
LAAVCPPPPPKKKKKGRQSKHFFTAPGRSGEAATAAPLAPCKLASSLVSLSLHLQEDYKWIVTKAVGKVLEMAGGKAGQPAFLSGKRMAKVDSSPG